MQIGVWSIEKIGEDSIPRMYGDTIFFYELYDECYEIDLETYKIVTIFDETDIHIHPDDKKIFNSLFNKKRLESLEKNRYSEKIDIRIKNVKNGYNWIRLKALVTNFAGRKKLVFYTYDIEDEKRLEEITKEKEDIVGALIDI